MESFTQPGDTHTTAAAPNPPNRYPSIDTSRGRFRVARKRCLAMDVPATYDALGSRILKQKAIAGATCRCEIYLK